MSLTNLPQPNRVERYDWPPFKSHAVFGPNCLCRSSCSFRYSYVTAPGLGPCKGDTSSGSLIETTQQARPPPSVFSWSYELLICHGNFISAGGLATLSRAPFQKSDAYCQTGGVPGEYPVFQGWALRSRSRNCSKWYRGSGATESIRFVLFQIAGGCPCPCM